MSKKKHIKTLKTVCIFHLFPFQFAFVFELNMPPVSKSAVYRKISTTEYQLENCPCLNQLCILLEYSWLVSTYVVCERLSVMQRHPESGKAKFVLKILRTPYSGIWFRTTHPPPINFSLWIQVQPVPEYPLPKCQTLTFSSEFKSDLSKNTAPPHVKL